MTFSFTMTPGMRIRPARFRSALGYPAQPGAAEPGRAIGELLNLHQQPLRPATPPQAPPPLPIDYAAIVGDHRQRALHGIGPLRFVARRNATAAATAAANQHITLLEAQRQRGWEQTRQDLDRWWNALLRNDPPVVLGVLAQAFAGNDAPAVVAGIDGAEVSLVALVPTLDDMPQSAPDVNPAGPPRQLTQAERAELHAAAVASHVLRTVRDAFAAAPGVSAARIVALQRLADGEPQFAVMLAARLERQRLDQAPWMQDSANGILAEASSELLTNWDQDTSELHPIDLEGEPQLAAVLDGLAVDDDSAQEPRTQPLPLVIADTPIPAPAATASKSPSPGLSPGPDPSPEPEPEPDPVNVVRAGVAAAWLLLIVIGLAGDTGTLLVTLGLPLVVIGLAAVVAGRLRWAWIADRRWGGVAVAAGFVVLLVAAGTTEPVPPARTVAGPASTTKPTATTTRTKTASSPSALTPTTVAPTATRLPATQPSAHALPPLSPPPLTTKDPRLGCDPSYPTVCIPSPPPDLNCNDVPYRNFVVRGDDPHGFDRNHDGVGCEG